MLLGSPMQFDAFQFTGVVVPGPASEYESIVAVQTSVFSCKRWGTLLVFIIVSLKGRFFSFPDPPWL